METITDVENSLRGFEKKLPKIKYLSSLGILSREELSLVAACELCYLRDNITHELCGVQGSYSSLQIKRALEELANKGKIPKKDVSILYNVVKDCFYIKQENSGKYNWDMGYIALCYNTDFALVIEKAFNIEKKLSQHKVPVNLILSKIDFDVIDFLFTFPKE